MPFLTSWDKKYTATPGTGAVITETVRSLAVSEITLSLTYLLLSIYSKKHAVVYYVVSSTLIFPLELKRSVD